MNKSWKPGSIHVDDRTRDLIAGGKYSKWAKDLDPETLYALLCFVGSFSIRTTPGQFSAESFKDRFPDATPGSIAEARYDSALEHIIDIFNGKTFTGGSTGISEASHAAVRSRLDNL